MIKKYGDKLDKGLSTCRRECGIFFLKVSMDNFSINMPLREVKTQQVPNQQVENNQKTKKANSMYGKMVHRTAPKGGKENTTKHQAQPPNPQT